jgi:CubicO group peptidase (beta-lactamase class C family)
LPKPLFEETIKPQVNSGTEMRNSFYGFGWFIENAGAGAVVYSHSGLNAGFKSYLFRIPEKQIMVAILSNRNDKNVILLNSYIRRVINQAAWN